jgi:elongation factor P
VIGLMGPHDRALMSFAASRGRPVVGAGRAVRVASASDSRNVSDLETNEMGQITAIEVRKGMLLDVSGKTCSVEHWNIWKSDRRSRIQMKFKEILTGRTSEVTAQPDDRYNLLESEMIDLEHSYRDGPEEVFYTKAGDEWRCPAEGVEDVIRWKSDLYRGLLVDGALVTVRLPQSVVATVAETEPSIKGQSGMKDATLENGIKVKVGMMVNPGDKVRIDSETLEYKERVS